MSIMRLRTNVLKRQEKRFSIGLMSAIDGGALRVNQSDEDKSNG